MALYGFRDFELQTSATLDKWAKVIGARRVIFQVIRAIRFVNGNGCLKWILKHADSIQEAAKQDGEQMAYKLVYVLETDYASNSVKIIEKMQPVCGFKPFEDALIKN